MVAIKINWCVIIDNVKVSFLYYMDVLDNINLILLTTPNVTNKWSSIKLIYIFMLIRTYLTYDHKYSLRLTSLVIVRQGK